MSRHIKSQKIQHQKICHQKNLSSEVENLPEIELRSLSSIYTHSNAEKIDAYLFSWNNVPENESESQRLVSYLQNDLNIS